MFTNEKSKTDNKAVTLRSCRDPINVTGICIVSVTIRFPEL